MSKLPSLTPEKVIKVLKKKGFVLDRVKGTIYYHPETNMIDVELCMSESMK